MRDGTADPGAPVPHAVQDRGRPAGFRAWSARGRESRVLFVGRGEGHPEDPARRRAEPSSVLAAVTPGEAAPDVAVARQVHGAGVLDASRGGPCGEGDALVTDRRELALAVVTADCVPVLVEAGDRVAAIHAGWRGLVAGVIPSALERLGAADGGTADWRAWIGPAIHPCCYEVGEEVARRVAAASSPSVVVEAPTGGRPHLDLVAAARHQLAAAGVTVAALPLCTRCETASLWSYRRQGTGAGRNLAFIWRTGTRDG